MNLKRLIDDDDAVSPVIGVILMVAITVILAAVIATFVLGLGDSVSSTAPQASFSGDYNEQCDGSDDGDGVQNITHDGGDSIKQSELYIRGSGFVSSPGGNCVVDLGSQGSWEGNGDASGSIGSASAVVAGDRINVGASSSFELRVVYEAEQGESSATLAEFEGPDA